jgi:hypothetical protein
MRNYFAFAIFSLTVASMPARAASTTFDFTTCTTVVGTCGNGSYSNITNPFSENMNGVTVTAVAFATAGTSSSNNSALTGTGTTANVGQYTSNGLGVCSSADSSCTDPQHQVDNNGSYEFILFKFSTAVNLSQITLANFGGLTNGNGASSTTNGAGDMDLSYWTGVSGASTTLSSVTNLGTGWSSQNNDPCAGKNQTGGCGTTIGGETVTTDSLSGQNVYYLLVGAAYNSTNCGTGSNPACGNTDSAADFFKIQSLTVTAVTTATPEPATFGLVGMSLAGLAFKVRRRRLN